VAGILDPAAYESQFGLPPTVHGDFNGDGDFDFDDIPGFANALAGARSTAASTAVAVPTKDHVTGTRSPSDSAAFVPAPATSGSEAKVETAQDEANTRPPARSAARRLIDLAKRPDPREHTVSPFHTARWVSTTAERDAVWSGDIGLFSLPRKRIR